MHPAEAVLVVVDMQNGFVSSKSRPVVARVEELVSRWEALGGPVVFTRFVNQPGSPYERLINWTRMRTEPETSIIDELSAASSRALAVLEKPVYSLFTPEAVALVERQGWTDLVLCGIATESCVLKSACDAFERDLTPWVVTDACFSHAGQDAHDAGLVVTGRFIGRRQLVVIDEVIKQLSEGTAETREWAAVAQPADSHASGAGR